jgi:hypothetical protein
MRCASSTPASLDHDLVLQVFHTAHHFGQAIAQAGQRFT